MSLTATQARGIPGESSQGGAIPVREFFTLDVRSLALFRVALGVMLLLDWVDRLPDLRVLYSDQGMLPRSLITGMHPFSVHMLHGSAWFQGVLLGVALLGSLAVLVGWKTPLACLLSWVLLISIHARNPALMQGGDHLLRALTFWSIFLPLGASWSVDRAGPGKEPASPGVLSAATVAYVFQICMVYWFAAAWKWLGPWREEGTAVYLALHVDHFPTRLGLWLREYPDICWWLTHGTIWLETLGPVLLLLPFHVGLQRLVAIAAFILFHAGLALCMELGHFPFVCMIAWLPFVPSSFWDKLESRLIPEEIAKWRLVHEPGKGGRLAIWRTFLFLGRIRVQEATTEQGQLSRIHQQGGWALLDEKGESVYGKEAVQRVVRQSPVWYPLARLLQGRGGERLAKWLAGGRGRASKKEGASPGWMPPQGVFANLVILFCLTYIASCNTISFLTSNLRDNHPELASNWLPLVPDTFFQLGVTLGIDQGWGLFAPEPGRQVGWFLVVGTQKNGKLVDAYHGGPVQWEKPEYLMLTYESGKWRKLRMNLAAFRAYPYLLPGFSRFYFEEWNRKHQGEEQLRSIDIYWMREVTVPPGETPPPAEKLLLGRYEPKPPPKYPGAIVVLGIPPQGRPIDLMRDGFPVGPDHYDVGPEVPVINPHYGLLVNLANTDASSFVLGGYARYLFEDWNRKEQGKRPIQAVEILRIQDTPTGEEKREVLARYPESRKP